MPLRTWRFNHTGSTPELHEDSTSLHFALLRLSRTSSASFNHGEVPAGKLPTARSGQCTGGKKLAQ